MERRKFLTTLPSFCTFGCLDDTVLRNIGNQTGQDGEDDQDNLSGGDTSVGRKHFSISDETQVTEQLPLVYRSQLEVPNQNEGPPQLKVEVENIGETELLLESGYSFFASYHSDVLLVRRGEFGNEAGCWSTSPRIRSVEITTGLESGESISVERYVVTNEAESRCYPTGTYRLRNSYGVYEAGSKDERRMGEIDWEVLLDIKTE